jgi:transmembrane sensor
MQKQEIRELIKKYNAGTCTSYEKELVESWYMQFEPAGIKDLSEEERSADLDAIWNSLPIHQPTIRRMAIMYRTTAAAAILVFLSIGIYYFTHRGPDQQKVIATIARTLKPGGNKAILTLSDGKQIVLTDAAKGQLASQSNATIEKTAEGNIVYNQAATALGVNGALAYNSMSTPQGGTYELTLSDGTKVTLDAASSIRYPVVFGSTERRVEITGQAYFEVAHNKMKPFRVSSKGQTVEVLGTHFNINAYSNEEATKTTLLEGSVKVFNNQQTALLKPGQQSAIMNGNTAIKVNNADIETAVAWKNGLFRFKRADLQTVMRQFSRWYNVEVVYEGAVPNAAITGKVLRTANAEQVLKIINSLGIKFKTDGKKIVISKNN